MKSLFRVVYFRKFLNVVLLPRFTMVRKRESRGILAISMYGGNVLCDKDGRDLCVELIHDNNSEIILGARAFEYNNRIKISDMRNRTISIVCMLLCLLGISRVSFAQQEDNLLRREYQVAMEEHVQNMIAALSMYSSDIYYENENVLRTRRVKLIRVFFRSEQAKM